MIVTMCDISRRIILYELFKVVNPRLALLALVFYHRIGNPRGQSNIRTIISRR